MPADIYGRAFAPVFEQFLVAIAPVDQAHVQRMVTQFVAHPSAAEREVHVQHRHDAVQYLLAAVINEPEARVCDNPQVVRFHEFLHDDFVVVLDIAYAGGLEPALVTTDAVRNSHACGVYDFDFVALAGKQRVYLLLAIERFQRVQY